MLLETQSKLQLDKSVYQTFVNTMQGMQPSMIPETYLEIMKEKYGLLHGPGCSNDDVLRAFLLVFNEYRQTFLSSGKMRWELQTALFDHWKGWICTDTSGAVMLKLLSIVKPTRKRRRSLSLDECEHCEHCECAIVDE